MPKKFIQVIGCPKSGKSSIGLNIRNACGVLWNDHLATTSTNGVRFIGSGLDWKDWNRLVGSDAFELEFGLDRGTVEFYKEIYRSTQMPTVKHIFVEGTFGKKLNYNKIHSRGFEINIFVPLVNKEVIEKIGNKDFGHYQGFQERILKGLIDPLLSGYNVTLFDPNSSLKYRVDTITDALGLPKIENKIADFKECWEVEHNRHL